MLKSCKYCGRMHDVKSKCPKKPQEKKENTEIIKFRGSSAWKKKRNVIRERDVFCLVCLYSEKLTKDKYSTKNLSVHHIESLEEAFEKRLDEDNLILLCTKHHKEAEAGQIKKSFLKALIK